MKDSTLKKNDESILDFEPLLRSKWRSFLYYILCVLTIGILPLLCYWFPTFKRRLYITSKIEGADYIEILESNTLKKHIFQLQRENLKLIPFGDSTLELFFTFKYSKYIYHESRFQKLRSGILSAINESSEKIKRFLEGSNQEESKEMQKTFGKNVIDIPLIPLFNLFVNEIITPFFFFQVFSFTIWYNNDYGQYATVIMLMTGVSICFSVYQIRKQNKRIRRIAYSENIVTVLRHEAKNLKVCSINSKELQNGDLVLIDTNKKIPADCLLVSGSCVVDESLISGETTPKTKQENRGHSALTQDNVLIGGTLCLVSHGTSYIIPYL